MSTEREMERALRYLVDIENVTRCFVQNFTQSKAIKFLNFCHGLLEMYLPQACIVGTAENEHPES